MGNKKEGSLILRPSLNMCATNLASESLATGIYRQV